MPNTRKGVKPNATKQKHAGNGKPASGYDMINKRWLTSSGGRKDQYK